MQNLEKILISQKSEKNFYGNCLRSETRLLTARCSKSRTAKSQKIIRDVQQKQDKAVAEYTKNSTTRINACEFKISKSELDNAYKNIDKQLLASIKKSIKNVRQYQKQIFIGKDKKFANQA
jgi:histidinol dehydrogenase